MNDEELGRKVREYADQWEREEEFSACFVSAGKVLISLASKLNSDVSTFTLDGVTNGKGEPLGDWEVVARRKNL